MPTPRRYPILACEALGVRAVFEVARRRLRETNWKQLTPSSSSTVQRTQPVVPASHAAWLTGPEIERDFDGLIPLGELISKLRKLAATPCLTRRESLALMAWYGLDRVPLGHPNEEGAIGALLAPVGSLPLDDKRVAGIRDSALAKISQLLECPALPELLIYGPTPDPRHSPWFLELSASAREICWEAAINRALGMIAVGPVESNRRQRLHVELHRYLASARRDTADLTHRKGLARPISLMAVALWREVQALRQRQITRVSMPPTVAIPVGLAVSSASKIRSSIEWAAWDIEATLDHAAEVRAGGRDPLPILRRSLGLHPRSKISSALKAKLYAEASHILREREDWEAVLIARTMIGEYPASASTVDACLNAAMVAGAHERYDVATRFLDKAEEIVAVMRPRGTCEPDADRIEYLHAIAYGRSGIARRRLESFLIGATEKPSDVLDLLSPGLHGGWEHRFGQTLAQDAEKVLSIHRTPSLGGDANLTWLARTHLRHAELLQTAALAAMTERGLHTAQAFTRRADETLDRVRTYLQGSGRPGSAYLHQLRKAELFQAILYDDATSAEQASARLAKGGWSIYRSTLPVIALLCEPAGLVNQAFPRTLRKTTERARDVGVALTVDGALDAFRRSHYALKRFRPRRPAPRPEPTP